MTPLLRKPSLVVAVMALALLPACAQPGAGGASQSEIEKIVREYILENPEIIEEALIALSEKEKVAQAAAAQAAIAANATELYARAGDYSIGPADAKVTVVEFFDYRCGYCKRSVDWVRAFRKSMTAKSASSSRNCPSSAGSAKLRPLPPLPRASRASTLRCTSP